MSGKSTPVSEIGAPMTYFPPPHPAPWKRATPGETGLDPDAVAAAARHAERT